MNEHDYLIQDWICEMQDELQQYVSSTPLIVQGIQPVFDMNMIDCADIKHIWFWYPMDEYTIKYWRSLIKQIDHRYIRMYVSTAEQLNQNIGLPYDNTPEVWVVSMEKL